MCSVSVVYDYWGANSRPDQWTRPMVNELKEIISRLDKLDEALGQKDCVDLGKAAWMKEIEDRLDKLEV